VPTGSSTWRGSCTWVSSRGANHALEQTSWLIPTASVYYQVGHLAALLATLGWAWCRHRDRYARARAALLGLTLTALAGYWLLPTAPPRLAMPGVVDTVAAHPVLFAGNGAVTGMVNLYAAMPSLHVAWAVWVALTVSTLSGHRMRRLVWLHPAATTIVVVATANHYVVDAIAGTVLALAAWALNRATIRRIGLDEAVHSPTARRPDKADADPHSPGPPTRPVTPRGVTSPQHVTSHRRSQRHLGEHPHHDAGQHAGHHRDLVRAAGHLPRNRDRAQRRRVILTVDQPTPDDPVARGDSPRPR
jgi:hypothetical protein